jgi:hypothetical protein
VTRRRVEQAQNFESAIAEVIDFATASSVDLGLSARIEFTVTIFDCRAKPVRGGMKKDRHRRSA